MLKQPRQHTRILLHITRPTTGRLLGECSIATVAGIKVVERRTDNSYRYYWYYYWTYSIDIQASVVTSTRSTTQTVFSVKTTDAGAASEYFSEKSRTLSLPTPAAATTLESLAGSTSFVSTPSSKAPIPSPSLNTEPSSEPSITEKPSAPFDPIPSSGGPDDNESSSSSESRSSSTTTLLRSGGDDGGTPPKNGGSGSSGAKPLWAGSDWKSLWVLALGVGTGVLAAVL